MKFVLVCISLVFVATSNEQSTDYLKLRKKMQVSACGMTDTNAILRAIHELEALDTTSITKNIAHYYLDVGKLYWLQSGHDKSNLDIAMRHWHAALYHDPMFPAAHWNLATAYNLIDKCDDFRKHLALCLQKNKAHTLSTGEREEMSKMIQRCQPEH
jgi:hypothetical protein